MKRCPQCKLTYENEDSRVHCSYCGIDLEYEPQHGDKVSKMGGDYRFTGIVVAVFQKLSGKTRFVVEDDRGVLHIFSAKNLHPDFTE